MSARFVNPLPFVSDIQRSVRFYQAALGLKVLRQHHDFVQFDNGFALHEGSSFIQRLYGPNAEAASPFGQANLVLYFEDPDLEACFIRCQAQAEILHGIERQSWGQRVFRFYDPDRHLIEVGEPEAP